MLESSGRVTVFNAPGPTVEEVDWSRLLSQVQKLSPDHRTVVCSGSLPPGSRSTPMPVSSAPPVTRLTQRR